MRNKRSIGIAEVKTLLFTGSMAVTLGFWYIFSNQDSQQNLNASQEAVVLPAQPPPGVMLDLPPIPTVWPSSGADQGQTGTSDDGSNLVLRAVEAPTQQVVRRSNLIIDGSKGGRNGGGGTVARTSSS